MNFKALVSEYIGTAIFVSAMVGSGIAGSNLSGDLQVVGLANTLATALVLGVLILTFGSVSGGHFNPVVSMAVAIQGGFKSVEVLPYLAAQFAGAISGAALSNAMFGGDLFQVSSKGMTSNGSIIGEVVATAGLVFIVLMLVKVKRTELIAVALPAWIAAGSFFTSSGAFANPAVTVGRIFTDSFAGIGPVSVPSFVVAQLLGAAIGIVLARTLITSKKKS
jgi:glycerol uptake facilitator-like aquaporin